MGSQARISPHYDVVRPARGHNLRQHLPQEDGLRPTTRGVKRGESHGDTRTPPTGEEQDHLTTKGGGGMRAVARRVTPMDTSGPNSPAKIYP